jgi:hypothetical protein
VCSQFPASGCCCYRSRRILTLGSEFVDVKRLCNPGCLLLKLLDVHSKFEKGHQVVPGYPPHQHIPSRDHCIELEGRDKSYGVGMQGTQIGGPRNRVQWYPAERRASHVGVKMPPRRRLGRFNLKMHFFPVHWVDGAFNATKAVALEEKKLQFVSV